MLDSFESQILRSIIIDLTTRVMPALTDPGAAATVSMASRLLANVLMRASTPGFSDITGEVAALQSQERREDVVLASATGGEGVALTPEALTPYVAAHLPGASVAAIEATLGGFSKRTLLLRLAGAPQLQDTLVLRCDESGGPVESSAADELAILQLMHRHGVAVAEPLWNDDHFPFGGTALATTRLAGGSAFDATGAALGPLGAQAAAGLANVLAQIHRVPVAQVELPEALRNKTLEQHVERMVAGYQGQWQRHRTAPSPIIDTALDYLMNNVPRQSGPLTVVHGDASLRNLLLTADGTISGLVDWELWHLGDPNEDLAYARPDIELAMDWNRFLDAYRAAGGVEPNADAMAYYGLFGAVRNAIFAASIIHGFVDAPRPMMRFAFGASYVGRKLLPDVARRLEALR